MEICGKPGRRNSRPRAESVAEVYTAVPLVEKGGDEVAQMLACSACAGDYEDPDRTAWTQDAAEDEANEETPAADREKFPAEK